MKKILFFMLLLFIFVSCSNTDNKKNIDENQLLTLIDVQKGERSSWYNNFNSYRENYRKFKVNSELILAIGEYNKDPNIAFQTAQNNGEADIKDSLSISSKTDENYGTIIDQVLERYKKGTEILYRYVLLMEVNKVTVYNLAKEEQQLIAEAAKKLNDAKEKAIEETETGDKKFLSKNYEEALIYYEKAIRIYEENELFSNAENISIKIEKVEKAIEEENYKVNRKKIEREKKIALLEAKRNKSLFDLEELLNLYSESKNTTRIKEVKGAIAAEKNKIKKSEMINKLINYIKLLTEKGYNKENYLGIINNYEAYYNKGQLNRDKIKNDIYKDISNKTIYILAPRSIYYSDEFKILTQIIQDKNPNYLIRSGLQKEVIDTNDYFKFKSYKIFYLESLSLVDSKGTYGYFANFSMKGILVDYETNTKKAIGYTNKRSQFTDYSSGIGAKEAVVDETIKEF